MNANRPQMPPQTFCWPQITPDYPELDKIGSELVEAMLRRDLRAGPHTARIGHFGDRGAHFFVVYEIAGPNYRIELRREQGRIGSNGRVVMSCSGISRVVSETLDVPFCIDNDFERTNGSTEHWVAFWLRECVLADIESYPEVPGAIERLTEAAPIAYPDHLPSLITACDSPSAAIIANGRYNGATVVPRSQMITLHCMFHEFGPDVTLAALDKRLLSQPHSNQRMLIEIQPLWANCLAVIDVSEYFESLRRLGPTVTLGLLDQQLGDMLDGAMTPDRYDGSFSEPRVLLRRHLAPAEVRVLGGPWPPLRGSIMPKLPVVAGQMLREASAEFRRAVEAWVAYLGPKETYDLRWVEVYDATKALAVALSGSRRLVGQFARYQSLRSYNGEPMRVWSFASEYARWEAMKQRREKKR